MLVLLLAKDEVHDDAEDHRDRGAAHLGGEGADRDLEDQAADAGDEDDRGDEDVLGLGHVDLVVDEHLDAARGDEAIEDERDATRDAGRNRLGNAHEGANEAKAHGDESRDGDDFGGSDFGDADDRDVFAVSGVGGAAANTGDGRGNTVANEGAGQAGVNEKIALKDAGEVLVVADVLADGDLGDGNEDEGRLADRGAGEGDDAARLSGEEEELRIIEEGLNGDVSLTNLNEETH